MRTHVTKDEYRQIEETLAAALTPDLSIEHDYDFVVELIDDKVEISLHAKSYRNSIPMDVWNGEREPDPVIFFAEGGDYDACGEYADAEREQNPEWNADGITWNDPYSDESINGVVCDLMEQAFDWDAAMESYVVLHHREA